MGAGMPCSTWKTLDDMRRFTAMTRMKNKVYRINVQKVEMKTGLLRAVKLSPFCLTVQSYFNCARAQKMQVNKRRTKKART